MNLKTWSLLPMYIAAQLNSLTRRQDNENIEGQQEGQRERNEANTNDPKPKEPKDATEPKSKDADTKEKENTNEPKPKEVDANGQNPKEAKTDESNPKEAKTNDPKPKEVDANGQNPKEAKTDESNPKEVDANGQNPKEAKTDEPKPQAETTNEPKPKEETTNQPKPKEEKPIGASNPSSTEPIDVSATRVFNSPTSLPIEPLQASIDSNGNSSTGIAVGSVVGGVVLLSCLGIYVFRKTAARKSPSFANRIKKKQYNDGDNFGSSVSKVPKLDEVFMQEQYKNPQPVAYATYDLGYSIHPQNEYYQGQYGYENYSQSSLKKQQNSTFEL